MSMFATLFGWKTAEINTVPKATAQQIAEMISKGDDEKAIIAAIDSLTVSELEEPFSSHQTLLGVARLYYELHKKCFIAKYQSIFSYLIGKGVKDDSTYALMESEDFSDKASDAKNNTSFCQIL